MPASNSTDYYIDTNILEDGLLHSLTSTLSQDSHTSGMEAPFEMSFEEAFSLAEEGTHPPACDNNSMELDLDAFLAQYAFPDIYDDSEGMQHEATITDANATSNHINTSLAVESPLSSSHASSQSCQSQASKMSSNFSTSYSSPGLTDTTHELALNFLSINSSPASPISNGLDDSPATRSIGFLSLPNTAASTRCSSPVSPRTKPPMQTPFVFRPSTQTDDTYSLALTSLASTLPSHIKERRYGSVYVKYCETSSRTAPYPASAPPSPSSGVHRRSCQPSASTKFFCPVTDCNRSYEVSRGDKGGFRTDNLGYHLRSVHGLPLQKKERALKWLERLVVG